MGKVPTGSRSKNKLSGKIKYIIAAFGGQAWVCAEVVWAL